MPNWCENDVNFEGSAEDIEKFIQWACSVDGDGFYLDFHKIRPLGLGNDDGGNPIWDYNIAIDKWGTKWDARGSYLKKSSYEFRNGDMYSVVAGSFSTAWGPPNGIYEAITQKIEEEGWDVSINEWFYREPGMRICGWLPE